MPKREPIQLTKSAALKLPAALKAKRAGLVGSTNARQKRRKSALDDIMKQIKKSNR